MHADYSHALPITFAAAIAAFVALYATKHHFRRWLDRLGGLVLIDPTDQEQ